MEAENLNELKNPALQQGAVSGSADTERPINLPFKEWWCPQCKCVVPPEEVTLEETHDVRCGGCGYAIK